MKRSWLITRGAGRGTAHLRNGCNDSHDRRSAVASVQAVRSKRWAGLLVNGRPSVRMAHRLPVQRESSLRLHLDRGTPPCCDVMLSVYFVTITLMSELPAGDTHDVIRHSGQVVAVVVPIEEYQQLRQAMQEQQVNEEFEAARVSYLARREAGAIRYVSHEEAGRRLDMTSR